MKATVVLAALLTLAAHSACSDEDPSPDGAADAADDAERDTALEDEGAEDEGTPRGFRMIDMHTHCFEPEGCDVSAVQSWQDGELFIVTAALEHYATAATLGDTVPEGLGDLRTSNELHERTASASSHVGFLASLECLYELPIGDDEWLARCLSDADRWLAAGALGFKDHAGKTFEGSGIDIARWVGSFNRLAGRCESAEVDPNLACQQTANLRFPLAFPRWRALVKELVETRTVPLLTHAVPFESGERCGSPAGERSCHDLAVEALLDFVTWAEANISAEGRRRIVLAHLAFLQNEPSALQRVLDGGLSVDLAQTVIAGAGCDLRDLVSAYPEQVVLGTDINVGQRCGQESYRAWRFALTGPAGVERSFRNTCRGTMATVGAGLADVETDACASVVREDAAERVLFRNAAELLGFSR